LLFFLLPFTIGSVFFEGAVPYGSGRVLRGGSWNNDPRNCRSTYRNRNHPDERNDNIGFRLVSVSFGLALPPIRSCSVPGISAFTDAESVVTEVLALLLSCREMSRQPNLRHRAAWDW
jgi:hypothetical protein